MTHTIHPTPPYNLQLTLDILLRYAHPVTDVAHDGAYWRVLRSGDGLALVRVTWNGDVDAPLLAAQRVDSDLPPDKGIMRQMAHILGAETDLRPFYTVARQDAALWRVVEPLVGLRWLRTATVFEALMTTIIEQQIAWTAAQKAQRWLVEWGGHGITHAGRTYYAFPTPEQIAAADVATLTPLKITFKRMNVIIGVAQQIVSGALDLESLRAAPLDDMYKTLTAIKGIGHWTASWTIQRTRGVHNYVGANDVALQAAVNHYFYGGKGRIPESQVVETFAAYGDYAGLAANYTIMRWVLDRYA